MCAVACPTWIRHPCCIPHPYHRFSVRGGGGHSPARHGSIEWHPARAPSALRRIDDAFRGRRAPRGGPRRALLFSPLKPVTGFLPAEPYEFSSWSSWQPRTWSFNVNDEAVGSIQARRSGYTGFAWSGQAPSRTRAKTRKTRSKREAVCDQKTRAFVVVKSRSIVSSRSRPSSVGVSESFHCRPSRSKPTRDHVVTSKHRGDGFDDRLGALDRRTRARVPRVPVPRRASRAPRPLGVKSQPPPEAADFAVTHRAPIGRHDGGLQPAQER